MPPFFALFAAAEGTGCIRDCMIGKSSESGKCFSHLFVLKIIARKVYFLFHIPACNGSSFSLTQKNGADSAPFFCAYSFPGPFPSSDVDGEGEGVAEGLGEGSGVVDGEGEGTSGRAASMEFFVEFSALAAEDIAVASGVSLLMRAFRLAIN